MTIENILIQAASHAAQSLYGAELAPEQFQLQKTRKEFEGDLTLVVFPLVKISKKGPEQTGQEVGEYLVANVKEITAFNVVKGFLNLSIATSYWSDFFNSIYSTKHFGFAEPNSLPRVIVEYSSPNTNKPLHLGHLRNNFLGYSVSQILMAVGHKVSKVQIINDRGIHICKSMVAWMEAGNGETPDSTGMKGDKLVGKYYVEFDKRHKAQMKELVEEGMKEEEAAQKTPIMLSAQELLRKWEAKDEATIDLWKKMNGWVYDGFESTYKTMGVDFDKLYYESETYLFGRDMVMQGLKSGVFFQKEDGSVWIDLTNDGLDQKAVLRKDGTAMYITQDIGTAILRFQDFPDTDYQIYTVGNEQEYHFKVLLKILEKLGFENAKRCFHLSYGMVELPEGKMKSREGTVVDADDLMAEMKNVAKEVAEEQGKLEGLSEEEKNLLYHDIGMSALKYFLLRVDPVKNMLFNPKESIDFNGNTGPFIQYGYVRTRAIGRKAGENWSYAGSIPVDYSLHSQEVELIKKIHDFPSVVIDAAKSYNPGLVANYAYELVKTFNGFYHDCPILREEDDTLRSFRVALSLKAGEVVGDAMSLLGVRMVERM
jgi:arginyl-tRNA synthetase